MQQTSEEWKPQNRPQFMPSTWAKGMVLSAGLAIGFGFSGEFAAGDELSEPALSREERQAQFQDEVSDLIQSEEEAVQSENEDAQVLAADEGEEAAEEVAEEATEIEEAEQESEAPEEEVAEAADEAEEEFGEDSAPDTQGEEGEVSEEEGAPAEDELAEGEEEIPLPEQADGNEEGSGSLLLPEIDGTGIIRGEVFGPSGEGLPGVVVSIPAIDRSTRADQEGFFGFADLPAAELTIQFNKLGYKVASRTLVLKEGESVSISQALEEQPVEYDDGEYEMDEVEVVGEYVEEESTEIVFDIQTETKVLGGSLGKAEFTKTGVSDAAGAVTKISGANIVGGKYAVVRGLGDRYTNTTLNGGIVPSADPSRKAVQLDLFPTDLLESVNIYKTFTPNLPAEFVGGLIAVETLSLPEERVLDFSFGVGSHSETHGQGDFYRIPGREQTFFADNNDVLVTDPQLDSGNLTGHRFNPVLQQRAIDARSYFFSEAPIFAEKGDSPELDPSFGIVFGDKFELSNGWKLGTVASFSHENESRYEKNIQSEAEAVTLSAANASLALPGRFTQTGVTSSGSVVGLGSSLYKESEIYTESVRWGLLLGGTLEMGENHSLSGTYFKYRSEDDTVTLNSKQLRVDDSAASQLDVISGERIETIGGEDYLVYENWNSMDAVFRDLEIWQASGSHDFRDGGRGLKFDWFLGGGVAQESRPIGVSQRFYNLIAGDGSSLVTPINPTDTQNSPSSFYLGSSTQDDSQETKVDATFSFLESSDEDSHLNFLFGGGRYNRTRETTARRLSFTPGRGMITDLFGDLTAQELELLLLEQGIPTVDGSPQTTSDGWIVGEAVGNTQLTYSAYSRIYSGYLMGDYASNGWEIVGGVRYEREERGFETQGGERVDRSEVNFFPGVILTKKFGWNDAFTMDLAWSRTIARPTFYEYVDAFTLDQANDRTYAGNPNLRDTFATNTDFKLGYREPESGDSISVSLFHKSLTDPIVQIQDPFASGQITWANFESANLAGTEIDFSKKLGMGFSLFGNVSYIFAEVEDSTFRNPRGFGEIGITSDGLEGQPNWLLNLVLSHEYEPWSLSSSLAFNYTGSYLSRVVPSEGATDLNPQPSNIIRQPFKSMDLIFSKSWEGEWWDYEGKLSFKVKNVLGSREEFTYGDLDLLPYESYSPGREFSLSFTAKF